MRKVFCIIYQPHCSWFWIDQVILYIGWLQRWMSSHNLSVFHKLIIIRLFVEIGNDSSSQWYRLLLFLSLGVCEFNNTEQFKGKCSQLKLKVIINHTTEIIIGKVIARLQSSQVKVHEEFLQAESGIIGPKLVKRVTFILHSTLKIIPARKLIIQNHFIMVNFTESGTYLHNDGTRGGGPVVIFTKIK